MADTYENCEEYFSSTKDRWPLDEVADYQRLKKGSATGNLFLVSFAPHQVQGYITEPRKPKFRL